MNNREQLIKKISLIEKQMVAKLEEIRATFTHKGIKGSTVESAFRDFLRMYLPRRLNVGQGEIIDRSFNTSNQVDVIITDENHPFTFSENNAGLFFIEGICASGEIKSILTTEQLINSLDRACNFKKLKMIPPTSAMMFANESDGKRFYTTPPFFILAFESQISLEKALAVAANYNSSKYTPGFTADGIFILNKGYIIDLGDGQGSFGISDENGISLKGWQGSYSQEVLFNFLGWILLLCQECLEGVIF